MVREGEKAKHSWATTASSERSFRGIRGRRWKEQDSGKLVRALARAPAPPWSVLRCRCGAKYPILPRLWKRSAGMEGDLPAAARRVGSEGPRVEAAAGATALIRATQKAILGVKTRPRACAEVEAARPDDPGSAWKRRHRAELATSTVLVTKQIRRGGAFDPPPDMRI
jgi:hypothetical protein